MGGQMDADLLQTLRLVWNWRVVLAIGLISLWGACGGLISYSVGKKGMPAVQSKFHQVDPEKLNRVEDYYDRWGSRLLLISMIPVIGTVIRLGAGIYGIRLVAFLSWSFIALWVRNWVLFLIAHGVIQAL
jgi:membrane protein YqaA with SNARE-associated domain